MDDSFSEKVFACAHTGKNFRFTKQEIALYKKLQVPLPQLCFDARYYRRFKLRNPRELYLRSCVACGDELLTPFHTDAPEPIHCEPCFLDSLG